jgi:hypothetical protein
MNCLSKPIALLAYPNSIAARREAADCDDPEGRLLALNGSSAMSDLSLLSGE